MYINVALCCSGDGGGGVVGAVWWWSPPCIGSDSAPGSGMVFHMHLLIWSRPTLMNIYFPSSVDEELEGGEGCHLPKVTPLTDSNPELQTRL